VTGAAGKVGRYAVLDLLTHGYDVVATDVVPRPGFLPGDGDLAYLQADLEDYGDTAEVLAGSEAVVHLANVPAPGLVPPARTYVRNTAMNANVFLAAAQLGLRRVVWASSETTLGLPFEAPAPLRPGRRGALPAARTAPTRSRRSSARPRRSTSARGPGIPFVALRLSNVILPEAYADFPAGRTTRTCAGGTCGATSTCGTRRPPAGSGSRPRCRAPAATSSRTPDTVMTRPTEELLDAVFPGVPRKAPISGTTSLFSIARARAELGFEPLHTWRDEVEQG
jgi:nucleoside-diphosphate-sugar epimerase